MRAGGTDAAGDQAALLSWLGAALTARAGSYLRNPVRQDRVTCVVCATPAAGFERCYQCQAHLSVPGLADATGFASYAVAGQASGYLMQGYKARPPVPEHRIVVALLAALALDGHAGCPAAAAGAPVTHWASVPSLAGRPGEHPLHGIACRFAPGREVPLAGPAWVACPRAVHPGHFRALTRLPAGSHVLLVDDTWAGGGHAQSAVLALRAAGAALVSVLVIARWLNGDYGANARFLRGLAGRDYDPARCPWTGGDCPGGARGAPG